MSRSAQIWIGEPFGSSPGSIGVDASGSVPSVPIGSSAFIQSGALLAKHPRSRFRVRLSHKPKVTPPWRTSSKAVPTARL
jgi:hypothetical protein